MKTERNILIAFCLNMLFSLIEFFGGLFTGSIAILSDSLHDFGDALSIGLSYFLEKKSKKQPDLNYTYGYVRYSVMGSIITTLILLVGSLLVIFEAAKRLFNPVVINYDGMILLAIFGIIINLGATYFTRKGDSLNQRAVNLHMLEDVLGWVVVLIGAICMRFTNLYFLDAILSIGVALYIFYHAGKNITQITNLFLEKTPQNIDLVKLKADLLKIKGVYDVHHLHIRSLDGYKNYATMHVVLKKYDAKIKNQVKKELTKYAIGHSTIEIELVDEECWNHDCAIKESNPNHHED